MSGTFTIDDLKDDFMINDVLANILLQFRELDRAYEQYSADCLLNGEKILTREEWIGGL